jgi:hypothetical protein
MQQCRGQQQYQQPLCGQLAAAAIDGSNGGSSGGSEKVADKRRGEPNERVKNAAEAPPGSDTAAWLGSRPGWQLSHQTHAAGQRARWPGGVQAPACMKIGEAL